MEILSFICERVLAPLVAVALPMGGLLLGARLRFFYLLHPRRTLRLMLGRREGAPSSHSEDGGKAGAGARRNSRPDTVGASGTGERRNTRAGAVGASEADADGGESPLRALLFALAGTLGVGNIVGVALAIAVGGAGSIFWMWGSALLAMSLKYAEVALAVDCRNRAADAPTPPGKVFPRGVPSGGIASGGVTSGGVPSGKSSLSSGPSGSAAYIEAAIGGRRGRRLGGIFAALTLLCALCMGGMIQASAVSVGLRSSFMLPPPLCGLLLAAVCLPLFRRGAQRLSDVISVIIPAVTLLYIALCLSVLLPNLTALPSLLGRIFREAMQPRSGAGGVLGFLCSAGLRQGVQRGLISNEAGCGTAPAAHARSREKCPARQGVLGIAEVAVDTLLLCSLTAFVVLLACERSDGVAALCRGEGRADGGALVYAAFSLFLGRGGSLLLTCCIVFFAFATILCWYYYGLSCLRGGGRIRLYRLAYCASLAIGATAAPALAWSLTDLCISLMTLINLAVLGRQQARIALLSRPLTDGKRKRRKTNRHTNSEKQEYPRHPSAATAQKEGASY